jgi:hypothetical protein
MMAHTPGRASMVDKGDLADFYVPFSFSACYL